MAVPVVDVHVEDALRRRLTALRSPRLSVGERLIELDDLRSSGALTTEQYLDERAAILAGA
ncbi:hypothetical protein [Salana multivorans]|uniref:hypothetical protein n=1 Tax=Salana multivorans TaxID=120377 RepID=UPI000F4BFF88|nr:hypothetical protein [Salana multivorans]